jgi:hypothetical protein
MATERKPVQVNPESELGRVLKRAAVVGEPVLVDTGDEFFELDVHPAAAAKTAPSAEQVARSIAGIRRAAGGWKGLVDADELTAYIYERRRIANRPPVNL